MLAMCRSRWYDVGPTKTRQSIIRPVLPQQKVSAPSPANPTTGTSGQPILAPMMEGNPYRSWIEMYAGDEYQDIARGAVAQLDRLAEAKGGDARFQGLAATFAQATRLEEAFWQMGLDA